MSEILKSLIGAPVGILLVVAGLGFLAVAVLGDISGRVQPGPSGRVGAAVAGVLLLAIGLYLQWPVQSASVSPNKANDAAGAVSPVAPAAQADVSPKAASSKPSGGATDDFAQAPSPAERSSFGATGGQELLHDSLVITLKSVAYAEAYGTRYAEQNKEIEPRNAAERLLVADVRLGNRSKSAFAIDNRLTRNTGVLDTEGRGYTPVLVDRRTGDYSWLSESILPSAASFQALVFSVPRTSSPIELVWAVNDGVHAFDAHFRITPK